MTSLGIGAIGLLVAVCIGAGSASYAVSGINPFYYSGADNRSSEPASEAYDGANSTPTPQIADASLQTGEYYYRPPAVTASYDYLPANMTRDKGTGRFTRVQVNEPADTETRVTNDREESATADPEDVDKPADASADGDGYMAERDDSEATNN